jgi:hypothetical protein
LTAGEWVDLGPELPGTGETLCVTEAVSLTESRLYRIKETP